jgi:hypothetical protein
VPAAAFVLLRDLVAFDLAFSHYSADALVAEHYPQLTSLNLTEAEVPATLISRESYFTDENFAGFECP